MSAALLEVRDLAVRFDTPRGMVHAVNGVSFTVAPGETVGVVGESGCGKSSMARALMGLVSAEGSIRLLGNELAGRSRRAWIGLRPLVQMVFQDPAASLNPRLSVGTLVAEPLRLHRRPEPESTARQLMARVGLPAEFHTRYPHELSGGQRQRVAIARALALSPKLLVCDEPVSALDVSVQAQVVRLLAELQQELGLAMLFITHDLALVEAITARVLVMYLGRVVEVLDQAAWEAPAHPYTRALRAAVPVPDPTAPVVTPLAGDPPSPLALPPGCSFAARCTAAIARCREERPELRALRPGHHAACHRAEEVSAWTGPTS
ncbi:MAG: ABC transporter ATP-binding protein [Acetobacteraceae bacterium]|nr:ABC transporter ATP-binding protein [Acetobacteraceae bacterium]